MLEFLNKTKVEDGLLIASDFNARTSVLNHDCVSQDENWTNDLLVFKISGVESGARVSMNLVVNARGRKLLDALACTNMTILNGNTLGDIHGKQNCHLYNGSSVVDYIIATENIKERVCNLIIGDLNSFSDHCPIHLKLDCSIPTSSLITELPM